MCQNCQIYPTLDMKYTIKNDQNIQFGNETQRDRESTCPIVIRLLKKLMLFMILILNMDATFSVLHLQNLSGMT